MACRWNRPHASAEAFDPTQPIARIPFAKVDPRTRPKRYTPARVESDMRRSFDPRSDKDKENDRRDIPSRNEARARLFAACEKFNRKGAKCAFEVQWGVYGVPGERTRPAQAEEHGGEEGNR